MGAYTQTIPESVAVLFGYEPKTRAYTEPAAGKSINFCDGSYCVTTYSAHVFSASAWADVTSATWSHSDSGVVLRYYPLSVETVDNTIFGISAGTTLTLHPSGHTSSPAGLQRALQLATRASPAQRFAGSTSECVLAGRADTGQT